MSTSNFSRHFFAVIPFEMENARWVNRLAYASEEHILFGNVSHFLVILFLLWILHSKVLAACADSNERRCQAAGRKDVKREMCVPLTIYPYVSKKGINNLTIHGHENPIISLNSSVVSQAALQVSSSRARILFSKCHLSLLSVWAVNSVSERRRQG